MSQKLKEYAQEHYIQEPVTNDVTHEYVGDIRPLTLAEKIEREKQLTEPDF